MLYFFSFQNMPVRLWACLRLYLAAIHSAAPEVCFFSVITNPPPFLIMLTQHSPGYPISARKSVWPLGEYIPLELAEDTTPWSMNGMGQTRQPLGNSVCYF